MLHTFPSELIELIASFLSLFDLSSLFQVHSRFACVNHERTWKERFQREADNHRNISLPRTLTWRKLYYLSSYQPMWGNGKTNFPVKSDIIVRYITGPIAVDIWGNSFIYDHLSLSPTMIRVQSYVGRFESQDLGRPWHVVIDINKKLCLMQPQRVFFLHYEAYLAICTTRWEGHCIVAIDTKNQLNVYQGSLHQLLDGTNKVWRKRDLQLKQRVISLAYRGYDVELITEDWTYYYLSSYNWNIVYQRKGRVRDISSWEGSFLMLESDNKLYRRRKKSYRRLISSDVRQIKTQSYNTQVRVEGKFVTSLNNLHSYLQRQFFLMLVPK